MFIVLLALLGLALIYMEFFLPGGILAVIGSISLLASIILCFIHTSAFWAILYILFLILAVIFICNFALWKMRKSKIKDRFYLEKDQEGFLAASFDQRLIGKAGTVFTELKPAGHILIEGIQYQALSAAGFLSKGETVEVIGGQGSHLIVRTTIKRTT